MSQSPRDEELFERIGAEIREQAARLDPASEAAALDRVGRRLRQEIQSTRRPGAVLGCAEIQRLLPAHLAGELLAEQSLLVADHTRTCFSCRRALARKREGAATAGEARQGGRRVWLWGLAAGLAAAVGLTQFLVVRHYWPSAESAGAALRVLEGALISLEGSSATPLQPGEAVPYGKDLVSPSGGTTLVELHDGSRVELNERSRLRVTTSRRGTTLALEGGAIIVEAAQQSRGTLRVATEDCEVEVTGTVFAVSHGTRGSRVSVFEGAVRVEQPGRRRQALEAGEQATTHASLARVSLAQEVAWSPRAEEHLALLRELTALGDDLRHVARPGLRHSSVLLSWVPETTVLYAGLPNLADTVRESLGVLHERLVTSEVLSQWWRETAELEEMTAVVERLALLGADLGDELVVAGWLGADGAIEGVAALAEVRYPGRFRARLEEELANLAESLGQEAPIHLVENPFAPGLPEGDGLIFWVADDLVAAAPGARALRALASAALGEVPNLGGSFHEVIRGRYGHGVDTLIAVDLAGLMARNGGGPERQRLERMGIDAVEHLVVEHRLEDQRSHRQAVLSFRDTRQGLASWLAHPGPMGSLSFVSPEASAAGAVLAREPRLLFAEILASLGIEERATALERLASFEAEHGWSLEEDLFAPLGGEIAFAIDGPVIPTPSWKVVVEVHDPARLQLGLERLVADLDRQLRESGQGRLSLSAEQRGGVTFHRVARSGGGAGFREASYAFAHGYLVVGPNTAVVDRALRIRDSGYGLLASPKLRALLPPEPEIDFSALWYHDAGAYAGPLAKLLGATLESLAGEETVIAEELGRSLGAGAAWAYGEERQIRLSSTHTHQPLGLLGLLAMGGLGSR